jgi:hypothetical protein
MLLCRDLRPGDLMLQYSAGTIAGRLISFGEWAHGQSNSSIIHAGVLFDGNIIIEALGGGILASDLRVQDRKYSYLVYRPVSANIAQGAASCAKMMFDIHGAQGSLPYSIRGAVGSVIGGHGRAATGVQMEKTLDDILHARSHPFFCSQFVVYVYQFVAEQNGMPGSRMFNLGDPKVSPALLANKLEGNGLFQKVGIMRANER